MVVVFGLFFQVTRLEVREIGHIFGFSVIGQLMFLIREVQDDIPHSQLIGLVSHQPGQFQAPDVEADLQVVPFLQVQTDPGDQVCVLGQVLF
ncbi:hypothetical protein SDC9_200763 [bioreactor metagenome]|uniref:Uncharacterized protein n=1 Tax=bioreactor metagenome TaxID=1076179 RepID=A0A645IRV1_9ZZZZ